MLQEGTIRPIQSPYASPVVLTRKNNDLPPDSPEAYRFAIDYRKLNAITKYLRYPLPVIDDLITNIPHTGESSRRLEGSQISCTALRALALNSREQLIREQREEPELGHIYGYLKNPDDGSVNATVCEGWFQDFKIIDGLLLYAKYSTTLGELRVYIPRSLREGTQSIAGPSHLRSARQDMPPTEGSKHDMTGQYDKARDTRTTTSGNNRADERRPVWFKQATAVRPCPYYLRSRVKQPEGVPEDRRSIGIESIPQKNIRRRSLSMEALDGDPVDRSE
ncbi:uncharacterized protein TNCV_3936411 [Trichonephila clavipes]|nr:uncharacterized protein TNCV_3936411 [Trichonephila clavipes]